MSYATQQDMIDQFTLGEMLLIADPENTGEVVAELVAGALVRASSEMDSFLSVRYPLPLATVPSRLVDLCCDIARYKLVGSNVSETDVVRMRYKDAIKALEGVRDRKIDLGVAESAAAPASAAAVRYSASAQVFSAGSLAGY